MAVLLTNGLVAVEVWRCDNLEKIGGHVVTAVGSPLVVEKDGAPAVLFDGVDDGLMIPAIPGAGSREFTIEVLFWAAPGGPVAQKILYAQDTTKSWRLLLETRLNQKKGKWGLDSFISTGGPKLGNVPTDTKRSYPVGKWHWLALRYDGRKVAQFVNGRKDFEREAAFEPLGAGQTWLGMRSSRIQWFAGAIREVRFHREAVAEEKLARVE